MAELSLDDVLNIIEDTHPNEETCSEPRPSNRATVRQRFGAGLRPGLLRHAKQKRTRKQRLKKKQSLVDQQANEYNASGRARGADHAFPASANDFEQRQKNNIKRKSLKSRPAWVKKGRVSRLNGFHMFLKEMKAQTEENIQGTADADVFLRQGSNEWSLLSDEAKKEYSEKAKAENSQPEALKASEPPLMASLPGGPWSLSNFGSGDSTSWPLRVDVMDSFLDAHGFDSIATEWVKDKISY